MKYSLRSLVRLALWFIAINVPIAFALSLSFQLILLFPILFRAVVTLAAFCAGGGLFLWIASGISQDQIP